jgi:hypothetical protein
MAFGITLLAWGNCVDNVFGLLGLAKVHSQMVWEWKNGGERRSLFMSFCTFVLLDEQTETGRYMHRL